MLLSRSVTWFAYWDVNIWKKFRNADKVEYHPVKLSCYFALYFKPRGNSDGEDFSKSTLVSADTQSPTIRFCILLGQENGVETSLGSFLVHSHPWSWFICCFFCFFCTQHKLLVLWPKNSTCKSSCINRVSFRSIWLKVFYDWHINTWHAHRAVWYLPLQNCILGQ